jgi:hypothetical protein
MADSCEDGHKNMGSIKSGEFFVLISGIISQEGLCSKDLFMYLFISHSTPVACKKG